MPSGRAATGALATRCSRSSSRIRSTCSVSSFGGGNSDPESNMSRHNREGAVRARWATTRCSRTVRPRKSSGCWNVRANPRLARDRGEACVTSSPSSIDPAGVGPLQAREHAEQGGLPRAVRADEAGDGPGLDLDGHIGEGGEPAEADGDAGRLQAERRARRGAPALAPSGTVAVVMTRAPRPWARPRPRRRRRQADVFEPAGHRLAATAAGASSAPQAPAVLRQHAVGVLGRRDGTQAEEHRQGRWAPTSTSRGSTAPARPGRRT